MQDERDEFEGEFEDEDGDETVIRNTDNIVEGHRDMKDEEDE